MCVITTSLTARGHPNGTQTVVHRAHELRLLFVACSTPNPVSTTWCGSAAYDGPDEVVQGHGAVVRVAAQKLCRGCALQVRVAHGVDFVVDAHLVIAIT